MFFHWNNDGMNAPHYYVIHTEFVFFTRWVHPIFPNLRISGHSVMYSLRYFHQYFDVFSTVYHSIELFHLPTLMHNSLFINKSIGLFHQPTLMHNFLYSLTICLFHYYPRHVSTINMPIFRRKNYIHTASDIFALCKRLHSTLVESALN